jgi:hypothetical protein
MISTLVQRQMTLLPIHILQAAEEQKILVILYYSTSSGNVRIWNGTAWEDAVVSTSGFATNGFAIAMAIAL